MYRIGARYFNGEGVRKDEAEGMRWYRKAAEAGHAESAANLGVGYLKGVAGLPQDNAQALRWLKLGADRGATNGMMALALVYGEGIGVPVDEAESHRWRLKAAEAGAEEAYRLVVVDYLQGRGVAKDDAKANFWLARMAVMGDANAAAVLGGRLSDGIGGPADLDEAMRWYRLSAELGEQKARFNLGGMLAHSKLASGRKEARKQIKASGLPVPDGLTAMLTDPSMPLAEATRRAEAGDADAQYELGMIYAEGRQGVKPDEAKAAALFRKAGIKHPRAAYYAGSYEILAGRKTEGMAWYRQAAQLGDPDALYNMGRAAMLGEYGVAKDPAQAIRWLQAGYEAGDGQAAMALGVIYDAGEAAPKDYKRAFELFQFAADLGERRAMYMLGKAYDEGLDVEKDKWQAGRWYLLGAQMGDGDAMLRYGMLFAGNGGLPEDSSKTFTWARKAAAAGQPTAIKLVEQLDTYEKSKD